MTIFNLKLVRGASAILNDQRKQLGFTLIELLVVISIIGVLTMLITMNFVGVRERGRDTKRKSDFKSIKTALAMYYNNCGYYPDSNSGQIVGCGPALTCDTAIACPWGSGWNLAGVDYIKLLPEDPSSTETDHVYYSYSRTDANNYTLTTLLENQSDTIGATSRTQCSVVPTPGQNAYIGCND